MRYYILYSFYFLFFLSSCIKHPEYSGRLIPEGEKSLVLLNTRVKSFSGKIADVEFDMLYLDNQGKELPLSKDIFSDTDFDELNIQITEIDRADTAAVQDDYDLLFLVGPESNISTNNIANLHWFMERAYENSNNHVGIATYGVDCPSGEKLCFFTEDENGNPFGGSLVSKIKYLRYLQTKDGFGIETDWETAVLETIQKVDKHRFSNNLHIVIWDRFEFGVYFDTLYDYDLIYSMAKNQNTKISYVGNDKGMFLIPIGAGGFCFTSANGTSFVINKFQNFLSGSIPRYRIKARCIKKTTGSFYSGYWFSSRLVLNISDDPEYEYYDILPFAFAIP